MKKKKIVLHGELAHHLPNGEFECVFHTAREAASAIEVNYPGFFELISDKYIQIIPKGQKHTMVPDQLASWKIGSDELHIFPVLEGDGGGGSSGQNSGVKAILGMALIAVAIVGTGGMAGVFSGSLTGAVFGNAFGITGLQVLGLGTSLVVSAFAQPPGAFDRPERVQNTIYTGPLNTNKEGSVLPYVAGESVIVGGVIINTELVVENT